MLYVPCAFHVDTGVEGSGDDGTGGGSQQVSLDVFRECTDRVMMPCDFEEFLTVSIPHERLAFIIISDVYTNIVHK